MEEKGKNPLQLIEIGLLLLIPSLIVFIGVLILQFRAPKIEKTSTQPNLVLKELTGLSPSDLSKDVLYYADQEVSLHGIVSMGEINCEEKTCTDDDKCCGCSDDRDIILKDINPNILNQTGIRIFDVDKNSFCQKIVKSCEYNCGDWKEGDVYEITGNFVVIKPYGMAVSRGYLEYYLVVKDQKRIPQPTPNQTLSNKFDLLLKKYLLPLISQDL